MLTVTLSIHGHSDGYWAVWMRLIMQHCLHQEELPEGSLHQSSNQKRAQPRVESLAFRHNRVSALKRTLYAFEMQVDTAMTNGGRL